MDVGKHYISRGEQQAEKSSIHGRGHTHVQGDRTGYRAGKRDKLNSTQAEPGQAITSAVAFSPPFPVLHSVRSPCMPLLSGLMSNATPTKPYLPKYDL